MQSHRKNAKQKGISQFAQRFRLRQIRNDAKRYASLGTVRSVDAELILTSRQGWF